MTREVKYLIPAFDINMGGIIVKQALPTTNVNQVDPFLLLHHGKFKFNDLSPAINQGIGPHPHRGFTPVTFVIEGEVHHRDSRGNDQIAKQGEVQWMHAAAGIVHSERPSQALVERKGSQEIIQLWINTPADKKMNPPKYQYTADSDIITFTNSAGDIENKLIAGKYGDLTGKIESESELQIIWSHAKANSEQTLNISTDMNSMLYLIKGDVSIKGFGKVDAKSLIVFENNAESINVNAHADAQYLILSGIPLNEPMVQQGPFVMNNTTQIMEAMRDYQMGKMGVLIE